MDFYYTNAKDFLDSREPKNKKNPLDVMYSELYNVNSTVAKSNVDKLIESIRCKKLH